MATHPRSQEVRAEINILVYTKPPENILTISQTTLFVSHHKAKKGEVYRRFSLKLLNRDSEIAILNKQINTGAGSG